MATAKGRAFLLYIGNSDADISGSTAIGSSDITSDFNFVAGAQEKSFAINNEVIDSTVAPPDPDGAIWATRFAGAKAVTVSASARFVNEASERRILDAAVSAEANVPLLLIYPADDTPSSPAVSNDDVYGTQIFGDFVITSLEQTGSLTDTFNWSITLESRRAPTFVIPSTG